MGTGVAAPTAVAAGGPLLLRVRGGERGDGEK